MTELKAEFNKFEKNHGKLQLSDNFYLAKTKPSINQTKR